MAPIQPSLFDDCPGKRYRRRRKPRDRQVWRTAIHEAGHAVVAHLLNVPFSEVTIRPALGGSLGNVTVDWKTYAAATPEVPEPSRLSAAVLVLVAGSVAEERLAFARNSRVRIPGSDYDQLHKLLGGDAVPTEERWHCIELAEDAARELINRPYVGIMIYRLAMTLTERIRLDNGEAVRAMQLLD